jgi:hypothetical protein
MRTRYRTTALAFAIAVAAAAGAVERAAAVEEFFAAKLRAGNETPATLGTVGSGIWGGQLDAAEGSLAFELHYSGLEGGAVAAAHLHLGQPGTTGGVIVHICGTGGTSPCPAPPGVVTGVMTASSVVAIAAQGVPAGDFARLVRALRRGDIYVNVHTATYPGGEVRGKVD